MVDLGQKRVNNVHPFLLIAFIDLKPVRKLIFLTESA